MYNVLLVYPKFPVSFWGGEFAREFTKTKASMPPLGLLTVAALFPKDKYNLRLLNMNVEPLLPEHLAGIDLVATSTMVVQQDSLRAVIALCNKQGVPVAVGGPHPTSFYSDIGGVSHFLLGEVEGYFHKFLADWEQGKAKHIYRPEVDSLDRQPWPSLDMVPLPRYDLINPKHYHVMCLQFSRGCPFDCEFCDIWTMYGRIPRTKPTEQIIAELDLLYASGWRGDIFWVDDNFIGNKLRVRQLLPHVIAWQKKHNYPFSFNTEASLNLINIEGLPELMVEAGFDMVFTGLETISLEALRQTNKVQNIDDSNPNFMLEAVRRLQSKGLEVTAGFIQGLDGDKDPDTFDKQIGFIQAAGIIVAMPGLLTVIKGTALYDRYSREGRLRDESSGNNVSISLNYIPEMDAAKLIAGYKKVIAALYDKGLKNYFTRCLTLIKNLRPHPYYKGKIKWLHIRALIMSLFKQSLSRHGMAYAKFILKVLAIKPRLLPVAFAAAIKGYHFRKITSNLLLVHELESYLEKEKEKFKDFVMRVTDPTLKEAQNYLNNLLADIEKRRHKINERFQHEVEKKLTAFYEYLDSLIVSFTGGNVG